MYYIETLSFIPLTEIVNLYIILNYLISKRSQKIYFIY